MTILELDPPQTPRQALAAVMLTLMQLVEVLQIEEEPTNLAINFDGRSWRVDIAALNAEGRLDRWLCGFNVNPDDLPRYGQPVPLPHTSDGHMH